VVTATEPTSSDATTQYYQRIAATSTSKDRVRRAERLLAKRTAKAAASPPAVDTTSQRNAGIRADQAATRRARILAMLADGSVQRHRAMADALGVPYANFHILVEPLVQARQILRVPAPDDPKRWSYRLMTAEERAAQPKVRQIDIPRFDPLQLRQKVESILRSGASYDLNEIIRNARAVVPQATAEIVGQLLEVLITEGAVRRIPIGSFTRYQAVA
jgi:hypothetical protein